MSQSTTDPASTLLALMAARERSSVRTNAMDLAPPDPAHSKDGGSAYLSARACACDLSHQLSVARADLETLRQAMSPYFPPPLPARPNTPTPSVRHKRPPQPSSPSSWPTCSSDALSAIPPVRNKGFLQEADRYVAREISAALEGNPGGGSATTGHTPFRNNGANPQSCTSGPRPSSSAWFSGATQRRV